VVLGVVVGRIVEGAGAVVEGVGGPAFSVRGMTGGDDRGAGGGAFTSSEASALDGGAETGAFAVVAGAAGVASGALGCGAFGRPLDAPLVPFVPWVSANTLTNPTTNARTHAPMYAARRFRVAARLRPAVPSTTGGVLSSAGNDSRTVAGETGTSAAFRKPRAAKRRRVSGRRHARAAACSSWSGP